MSTLAIADPRAARAAVGTGFTYQGQLRNTGAAVDGTCSFIFKLFDAAAGGAQQGPTLTYDGVGGNPAPLAVTTGTFTTEPPLDFGNQFNGDGRWLDIQVKCGADPGYTSLGRHQLQGAPYAISTTSLQGRPISQTAPSANDVLQWNGAAWAPAAGGSTTLIPFSTGVIMSGATVVSASPRLMGFGSNTVEVINGSGESTSPPEAGGFAFPIQADGIIQNLQISADLLVASVASINVTPLIYQFTVFKAPSVPNNGIAHVASPYVTTPFSGTITFGGPGNTLTAGTFYSATNTAPGPLVVSAGDRIGIRVRTVQASDPSAADITQLSFSACLSYTPQ